MNITGKEPVDYLHKKLGKIMWEFVGMGRTEEGLKKALVEIPKLREEFWTNLRIPGTTTEFNPELQKANWVADFIDLGELMARDALNRKESCGGHFREESQMDDGEAKRNDEEFSYVAAWEYRGNAEPQLNKEPLNYEVIQVSQRNYK